MVLPTNVDATYADSGTDPSQKLHQQAHDEIHDAVNALNAAYDADVTAGFVGTFQAWLEQIGSGGAVDSVNGATGAVVLGAADIDATATPTNYTAGTADVEAHLAGIDTALASAGGSVAVEDDGTEIVAVASALNFAGSGVTVTDAGAGEATVTIPGGGLDGTVSSTEPVTPTTGDVWVDTGTTVPGGTAVTGTRAYKSAAVQSIPNSAHTKVTLDVESFDDAAAFASSTYTVPATGRYRITGQIEYAAAASTTAGNNVFACIWLGGVGSGSRVAQSGPYPPLDLVSSVRVQVVTGMVQLTAGNTIELGAFQLQGSARNVATGSGSTWLCVEKIG